MIEKTVGERKERKTEMMDVEREREREMAKVLCLLTHHPILIHTHQHHLFPASFLSKLLFVYLFLTHSLTHSHAL